MKEVIILSGISGSGKSTYARKIADTSKDVCIVSADHYFMVNGEYVFDANNLGEAHGQCLRNYTQALLGDATVIIVDNTNTTAIEIAPYVALAKAYKADCSLVTVHVDADVAVKRNCHGVSAKTIHNQATNLFNRHLPFHWKINCVNVNGED